MNSLFSFFLFLGSPTVCSKIQDPISRGGVLINAVDPIAKTPARTNLVLTVAICYMCTCVISRISKFFLHMLASFLFRLSSLVSFVL
jgi:hypothetical protein